MRFESIRFSVLLTALFLLPSVVRAETLEWTRQLGTSESDFGRGVSADGLGNVYITGFTSGDLGGANAGGRDAFISKYDDSGTLAWTRQLGTSESDYSRGVSADGLGNVYITGYTSGDLGGANAGGSDAFISKFDDGGTLEWTRQLGTSEKDYSAGVSADGLGNVYITGFTRGDLGGANAGGNDAYISKYDDGGTLAWTRQIGTNFSDWSLGVSADGLGNVYFSGRTQGDLDGTNAGDRDAFVSKYDDGGTLEWTRQLGTSERDWGYGVSADGLGNVYTTGYTTGDLDGTNAGGIDAFINKYDDGGTLAWTRQLGSSESDISYGVSADGLGNVYISGNTGGSLGGTNAGSRDAFISKYDDGGTLAWTRQIGTSEYDSSFGVSADGLGNVYFSGYTQGSLGANNAGGHDVFVVKFTTPAVTEIDFRRLAGNFGTAAGATLAMGDISGDGAVGLADVMRLQSNFGATAAAAAVPEPSSIALLLIGLTGTAIRFRRRRRAA